MGRSWKSQQAYSHWIFVAGHWGESMTCPASELLLHHATIRLISNEHWNGAEPGQVTQMCKFSWNLPFRQGHPYSIIVSQMKHQVGCKVHSRTDKSKNMIHFNWIFSFLWLFLSALISTTVLAILDSSFGKRCKPFADCHPVLPAGFSLNIWCSFDFLHLKMFCFLSMQTMIKIWNTSK